MSDAIGYSRLVETLNLRVRALTRPAVVSRSVNRRVDAESKVLFPTGVAIDDTPVGHLEFALRHEGVDLEIIEAAFEHIAPADLVARINVTPNGESIRRACFLWEWLTGNALPINASPAGRYVDLFPGDVFVTAAEPVRAPKYRVRDNALGTPDFCPTVRRAAVPHAPSLDTLFEQAGRILRAAASHEHYERAIRYLYLSETRGSYAIEDERPSSDKQERFMRLLQHAGDTATVSEEWLVGLQNAVVRDAYSQEASYRRKQNWLEDATRRITFFPPPPTELGRAMAGWEAFVNDQTRCRDILVKAACASFGFVYLHPFMDGNGRLHRFLIHHALARSGGLPDSAILPVSAVMLKRISEYFDVLTGFSRPVTALWDYRRTESEPVVLRSPGSRPYRFFSADREVAFLHEMIRAAVAEEIPRELAWLRGYDEAFETLDRELDLPQNELARLIRMAYSNGAVLSRHRRKQHSHLPDAVLDRIEAVVRQAFDWGGVNPSEPISGVGETPPTE